MDKLLQSKRDLLRPRRYLSPEMQAEAIIQTYEENALNLTSKIQNNLEEQNGSLTDRMKSRQQINRRKTFSPTYFSNLYNLRSVQTKISETIEELIQNEQQQIKEVKKKYRKIITSDNCVETVSELNEQVEQIKVDFDRKKKTAISQILSSDC